MLIAIGCFGESAFIGWADGVGEDEVARGVEKICAEGGPKQKRSVLAE